MKFVPKKLLKKLYNHTSLKNAEGMVRFSMKNRLSPVTITEISGIAVDGDAVPRDLVTLIREDGTSVTLAEFNSGEPVEFPLGAMITAEMGIDELAEGNHDIEVVFQTRPFAAPPALRRVDPWRPARPSG